MTFNTAIGAQIKKLRIEKGYTLQQLSEKSDLSIGFLSQMERGMSAIAVDTLANIADILDTDLNYFFKDKKNSNENPVIRSHQKEYSLVNGQIIQYILAHDVKTFNILPRFFELLPFHSSDMNNPGLYHHWGEEFIYLLEGVLTLYYDGNEYLLYPGDSILINSSLDHNWINQTNKIVRFLSVNSPNPYQQNNIKE